MEEKELVLEYKLAKEELETLEEKTKQAKERFDKAQSLLVEALQLKGASQSAKYDGIGRVTVLKPLIGARSKDEGQLFEYLRETGRSDLIKETVHHKTLSTFVKEKLDIGDQIPEFIEYWYKPSTRLTK